jgi:hypothetical protein
MVLRLSLKTRKDERAFPRQLPLARIPTDFLGRRGWS